jgi:hypothetical protein
MKHKIVDDPPKTIKSTSKTIVYSKSYFVGFQVFVFISKQMVKKEPQISGCGVACLIGVF